MGELETALKRAGKGYVLGANSTHHFRSWGTAPPVAGTAEQIADGLDKAAWQRLSAGDGAKGARLHDWAYCALADLDAAEYDKGRTGLWTRGLLVRRNIADGDLAFFSTWCPAGTDIITLVRVEGHRWVEPARGPRPQSGTGWLAEGIEDSFETAKNELGLDHNETRSWHGWHRHVSLVMLAFAMMAVIRHKANTLPTPPKTLRLVIHWPQQARASSDGPSRKSDASPTGSRNAKSSPPPSSHGHVGGGPTKPQLNKRISQPDRNCNASEERTERTA